MVRTLLTGHAGSRNRGCEAIARCTINIIRQHLPDAQLRLLSFDADSDRTALKSFLAESSIWGLPSLRQRKFSPRWFAYKLPKEISQRVYYRLPIYYYVFNWRLYRSSDLVISIGGDNFTEEREGRAYPPQFFGELELARSLGAITVIWAANIGPYKNKVCERRAAQELRKVDLILLRDKQSLSYLHSIGVHKNVRLVADPAFLLSACNGSVPLDYSPKRLIGINMSALVARRLGRETYLDSFVSLVEFLLKDPHTSVLLIPHVIEEQNNDIEVCYDLADSLQNNKRVCVMGGHYRAAETKQAIAQCDYFFGARTHSTIASLSSYVPTISVAYSAKAHGINADLFGHTNYVIPITQLRPASLIRTFNKVSMRAKDIRRLLRHRVPQMRARAYESGRYLRQMLERKGLLPESGR